jgi:hypothetical protein
MDTSCRENPRLATQITQTITPKRLYRLDDKMRRGVRSMPAQAKGNIIQRQQEMLRVIRGTICPNGLPRTWLALWRCADMR